MAHVTGQMPSSPLCPAGQVMAVCLPAGLLVRDFVPPASSPFFCWPLFSLIKGIQFPSVAWWYLVPDTSGSVMSSEREERSSWMQKKEGAACAHCQSVRRADAWLSSIHLSPQLIAPGAVLESDFDCHARHSQPQAHPHAPPQRELRPGICSWKDIGRASCTHCVDFDRATLYHGAALLLLAVPLKLIHRVTDKVLSCSCVCIFTLLMIQASTWFPFTPTHLSSECQLMSVTHSDGCTNKQWLPFKSNWWHVASFQLDWTLFPSTTPGTNLSLPIANPSALLLLLVSPSFMLTPHSDSLWTHLDTPHLCF